MNQLHIEHLPNELIIYIFEYFHGEELFRSFFNLNNRLNNLIKSINTLSLIISKNNQYEINNFHIFSSYLYTLIINDNINLNLRLFSNIHRLILIHPINNLLVQLNSDILYNLEHLSIKYTNSTNRISYDNKIIFLNNFPNLKSYDISNYEIIQQIEGWQQSLTLCILKLGYIDLLTFQTVLSVCPNLYYFDLGIVIHSESLIEIKSHINLKQLILRTSNNALTKYENVSIFKNLFLCLSNLEKLSIHRKDNISIIKKSFITYDWLSSIIQIYLPVLKQFNYYFHVFQLNNTKIQIGPHLNNILKKIIENFYYVHNNRYHARLIID